MRQLAALSLGLLAACAGPPAPENPNSVPNVLLSINAQRGAGEYIYITGGPSVGPAPQSLTTFMVLPDDRLLCTFQADDPRRGGRASVTAHRLIIPGLYAALSQAVLPNDAVIGQGRNVGFIVETKTAAGKRITPLRPGDPRFDRLSTVFKALPTPCWRFI